MRLIFVLGNIDACGKRFRNSPAFDAGIRSAHATSQDLLNHCKIDDSLPQSVGQNSNHAGVEASYVSEAYILQSNISVKQTGNLRAYLWKTMPGYFPKNEKPATYCVSPGNLDFNGHPLVTSG